VSDQLNMIDLPPTPPDRPADAHKGTFGTVIVVGGCATMMGAPALCASAALRSGVGLVKIATDPIVLATAIAIEPGATGIICGDDIDKTMVAIDEVDPESKAVLAIGPGLGKSQRAEQLVGTLLAGKRPVVLDADGLNVLPAIDPAPQSLGTGGLILTPHPGEFGRLAQWLNIKESPIVPKSGLGAAAALARKFSTDGRAVVVLKGNQSVVTDGQSAYVNQTGNPALATAGSGDVLTGCIAALMAQAMKPFEASILGAYLHGLAADLWADEYGQSGLSARALATLLPDAFSQHRRMLRGDE